MIFNGLLLVDVGVFGVSSSIFPSVSIRQAVGGFALLTPFYPFFNGKRFYHNNFNLLLAHDKIMEFDAYLSQGTQ